MATMVATTPEFAYDSNRYPDYGATNHITPDLHNLMNKTEFAGQDKIMMGNGTGLNIKNIGQSSLSVSIYFEIAFFKSSSSCSFYYQKFAQCL